MKSQPLVPDATLGSSYPCTGRSHCGEDNLAHPTSLLILSDPSLLILGLATTEA